MISMNGNQSIDTPWGVSVFGAASVDAAPDLARLRVAISQTENTPGEAFAATRSGVNRIREVLRGHEVPETAVSTSRLNLSSQWSYGDERTFLGYECNGTPATSGDVLTVRPAWNGTPAAGASTSFGFTVTTNGNTTEPVVGTCTAS
jgi:hypothetical protein